MGRRTIAEINDKIKQGSVVALTAREMVDLVRRRGVEAAAKTVDVVTTGTFAPVLSCGLLMTFKQPRPRIKAHRAWLNGVPACAGLGPSQVFLSAGEPVENDPLNRVPPGEFGYGGGHVIEDLISGEEIILTVHGYAPSCHPRPEMSNAVSLNDLESATLIAVNPAAEQWPCGVNLSDATIHTFLGTLKPRLGNANFCSAGALSPFMKGPLSRFVGPGTGVFLGGGLGQVVGSGAAQPDLTLIGRLEDMSPRYVVGLSLQGFGCALALGVGLPLPILDEEAAAWAGRPDEELFLAVKDMAHDYPANSQRSLGLVSLAQLFAGSIPINGQDVPAVPLSSRLRSQEICQLLKKWIAAGRFHLGQPAPEAN